MREELYSGKAKSVFTCDNPDQLVLHFRDDTSAFDGEKTAALAGKGEINNRFNAYIMEQLEAAGIATHFIKLTSEKESLVKRLDMIPVECVIRNIAAGSVCRRLGIKEGTQFSSPLLEFFYKDDALHDPMINKNHIRLFNWATQDEVEQMEKLTYGVNEVLQPLFAKAGILLVDYKLEFGRYHNEIILGDEFTPDGCRLWDAESLAKLDKDRFRKDLGKVVESYQEVAKRIGV